MYTSFIILLFLLSLQSVHSHSRWRCPAPRSPRTGIKDGPCGRNDYDDFTNTSAIPVVRPGPMRVIFEESIFHTGAPFRISLSADGTDDPSRVCVLLDHIPHNDDVPSRPNINVESSYIPYVITIDIPDVRCERCSLHLANPMTDKIGSAGSPGAVGCTDPDGSCFSVYHSCTQPIRIAGRTPRDEYVCPVGLPYDWPTTWEGDGGDEVDASVPFLYRRQASVWGSEDHMLQTVPDRYREDVGTCGSGYEEIVEEEEEVMEGEEVIEEETPLAGSSPATVPVDSRTRLNQIRVDIMYDNSPEQTSWALVQRESTNVIYVSRYGTVTSPGLASTTLEVPDGEYSLYLIDSVGDGISSSSGGGGDVVTIDRLLNGEYVRIASFDGTFENIADVEFTL